MRRSVSLAAFMMVGVVLLLGSSARAGVTPLLSLIDPPDTSAGQYVFDLTAATGTTTTISFLGRDKFGFEYASEISVTHHGDANLLGATWLKTPAASGSNAKTSNDGTTVPAVWFGGTNYDTFSQTFDTTPGQIYELTFSYTPNIASKVLFLMSDTFNSKSFE